MPDFTRLVPLTAALAALSITAAPVHADELADLINAFRAGLGVRHAPLIIGHCFHLSPA
jgi:hypothetical protein